MDPLPTLISDVINGRSISRLCNKQPAARANVVCLVIAGCLICKLKLPHFEKATKFEKIFHLKFDVLSIVKFKVEDFSKLLWPSQNIRTLIKLCLCTFNKAGFALKSYNKVRCGSNSFIFTPESRLFLSFQMGYLV